MAKWFYYNKQGDKIETTAGRLKGLAKQGLITPETIVENEEGKRSRAGKVKGFTFVATAQTEIKTSESATAEFEDNGLLQTKPPIDIDEHTLLATVQKDICEYHTALAMGENPFTAPMPKEVNPFTAPMPQEVNPFTLTTTGETNPLATPARVANREMLKKVATDFINIGRATKAVAKANMRRITLVIGFLLVVALICIVVPLAWSLLSDKMEQRELARIENELWLNKYKPQFEAQTQQDRARLPVDGRGHPMSARSVIRLHQSRADSFRDILEVARRIEEQERLMRQRAREEARRILSERNRK